jgi:hypothetical protein
MKRDLKVGEASSKIVCAPGSRLVAVTATAAMRGSADAAMVEKNEPKLLPDSPILPASNSGRAASQS